MTTLRCPNCDEHQLEPSLQTGLWHCRSCGYSEDRGPVLPSAEASRRCGPRSQAVRNQEGRQALVAKVAERQFDALHAQSSVQDVARLFETLLLADRV